MRVTVLCLVGAGILLGLGLAGATASVALAGVLLMLCGGLYFVDPPAVGVVAGVDVDGVLEVLWLAPGLAALPLPLELGATPAELQALGGLLGLVGMANYFLRPIYLLSYAVGRKLRRLGGDPDGR